MMWLKVLVADEDPQSKAIIGDRLMKFGCEVMLAHDGRETLEKTLKFAPHLILLDASIAEAENVETLSAIRKAASDVDAKLFAISNEPSGANGQSGKDPGFDGHLLKPFDAAQLRDFIGQFRLGKPGLESSVKILCVDDEPLNVQLLEAILEPAHYEVISAQDGYQALDLLKHGRADIILLDVMMPGIDGYEVCRLLKAAPETSQVPVIMITSLASKEDKIRSIEAGAEDFITKPFDTAEVLTRIRKLLEAREQNAKISSLYTMLAGLTERGSSSAESTVSKADFDFSSKVAALVLETGAGQGTGARGMLLGTTEAGWSNYDFKDPEAIQIERIISDRDLLFLLDGDARIFQENDGESSSREVDRAADAFAKEGINPGNYLCRAGQGLCIASYGFNRPVDGQESIIIKAIAMQINFLRTIAKEINETEKAFDYLVFTLARAAELNDHDTGTHILRVGAYAALLAEKMGLPMALAAKIGIQAQLHDVGKLHVPIHILKKTGKLTSEEFELMQTHAALGAKIIGDHPKLATGRNIAHFHHERWDGSGYPNGLKGAEIPLEARITSVADQYDALRSLRPYKPAFSHEQAYQIITEGDGRTLPEHFDPQVLATFKAYAPLFGKIHTKFSEQELALK